MIKFRLSTCNNISYDAEKTCKYKIQKLYPFCIKSKYDDSKEILAHLQALIFQFYEKTPVYNFNVQKWNKFSKTSKLSRACISFISLFTNRDIFFVKKILIFVIKYINYVSSNEYLLYILTTLLVIQYKVTDYIKFQTCRIQ